MQEIAYHFFFLTKKLLYILYINIGDIMRKKFKTRKRIKLKGILILIISIYTICVIRSYILNIKLIKSNEKFIYNTLYSSNNYVYLDKENKNIVGKITNYIKNNIFNNPVYFIKSQLNYNYDDKNEDTKDVAFMYEKNEMPLVYIYNSHQEENYSVKYLEEYNIMPDVLMAANMLKEKLENKNIKTIVEEENISEYMRKNNMVYAKSYQASRVFLEKIIDKYKSIKLFIDLHRDSIPHESTSVNMDGKEYAKILFVVGLEHDSYEKNLETANKLNSIILEKYPFLTRGIMKKKGTGVNGIYNQDLKENIVLIEVGGNENNIDEINNTLDVLSNVIGDYLNEKEQ